MSKHPVADLISVYGKVKKRKQKAKRKISKVFCQKKTKQLRQNFLLYTQFSLFVVVICVEFLATGFECPSETSDKETE